MTTAAVIGTGRIAHQHLACLAALTGTQTLAVCDLSPARGRAAAERYGIGRAYTDHRRLLEEVEPDVVHVTTPPASHVPIALDALAAGAHVFVEKPAATSPEELERLLEAAADTGRSVVEGYTYAFSEQVLRILELERSGELGQIVHVDVLIALDVLGAGSAFSDPSLPHPALEMPGGIVADFLTHLASLAVWLVGPHRGVQSSWRKRADRGPDSPDEMRALVDAEHGTAVLGFTAHGRPEGFWLRVEGTRMRITANLFETLFIADRVRPGPRALSSVVSGLAEGAGFARGAVAGLARKLSPGPGSYEGLWTLIEQTHSAVGSGSAPPVSAERLLEVNRLVGDIAAEAPR
jgi:predicted dehydrogenase